MSNQIGWNCRSNINSNNQELQQQKLKDDQDKQCCSQRRSYPCVLCDKVFSSPQALGGHRQGHQKKRMLEQNIEMEISRSLRDHQLAMNRYYDRAVPQTTPQLENVINGLSRWNTVSPYLPNQQEQQYLINHVSQTTPQLENIINGLSKWNAVSRYLPNEQEQQYSVWQASNYLLLVNGYGPSGKYTKPYINQLEKPWVVSDGSASRANAVEIEGLDLDLKL